MIKSPLSGWMGGKYQLSKQVVSMIPQHRCYCEPFAGAAWVFFRKDKSEVEVLNDINRIKGKFLLSLNDTPEVREIFAQFIIEPVSVRYSCGTTKTVAKEVLIRNYELQGN